MVINRSIYVYLYSLSISFSSNIFLLISFYSDQYPFPLSIPMGKVTQPLLYLLIPSAPEEETGYGVGSGVIIFPAFPGVEDTECPAAAAAMVKPLACIAFLIILSQMMKVHAYGVLPFTILKDVGKAPLLKAVIGLPEACGIITQLKARYRISLTGDRHQHPVVVADRSGGMIPPIRFAVIDHNVSAFRWI